MYNTIITLDFCLRRKVPNVSSPWCKIISPGSPEKNAAIFWNCLCICNFSWLLEGDKEGKHVKEERFLSLAPLETRGGHPSLKSYGAQETVFISLMTYWWGKYHFPLLIPPPPPHQFLQHLLVWGWTLVNLNLPWWYQNNSPLGYLNLIQFLNAVGKRIQPLPFFPLHIGAYRCAYWAVWPPS